MICHTLHLIRELKAQPSQPVGEVFVFVDECHRTQSGKLHRTMKAMMPDAVFIGFTGTPLLKKDKKTTLEVFGGYIHTYKFDEAVEDGVMLDLIYEARELKHGNMILRVRPGTDESKRQAIVEEWYRAQLKQAVTPLVTKWEPLIGVKVERLFVQQMKTKWGSCTPKSGNIRLNTDLAKKPHECLEYILVHEMVHLLEPTHNARFVSLMDSFVPKWQFYREALNRLPVRHEHWDY